MNSAFLVATIVLAAALFPLAVLTFRRAPVPAVVALEVGGILSTLVIICYSEATQSTAPTGLAVITAVMTWLSGLVYVRLMDKQR